MQVIYVQLYYLQVSKYTALYYYSVCVGPSTTGLTPTATKTFTEDEVGAVFIFSLSFGVVLGIIITCTCTIIAVCIYCTLRRKK